MSAPNKLTGKAQRQRTNLPRRQKPMLFRLRMNVYDQLMKLQSDDESLTSAVERLILQARPVGTFCE